MSNESLMLETKTTTNGAYLLSGSWPPPASFCFLDENGTRNVLILHRDGRVEIGNHLTPDEAGQKVFEMLRALWGQYMGTLEKERAAWARLVKATAEERDAAACAIAERERGARGGDIALEQRELMAARQALRDLGVGVDALLSD